MKTPKRKVKNICVYSEDMARDISNDNTEPYTITNAANDIVNFTIISEDYVFELFNERYGNLRTYHVSDFGAKGDGVTYDTGSINLAILYTLHKGGTLLFNGDATYVISSPILIYLSSVASNSSSSSDFNIDFNHCRITISYDEDSRFFINYTGIPETMIYMNEDFRAVERRGTIQNVQLYAGFYKDSGVHKSAVENGIYIDSSRSLISYKNIKILDATRGVYMAEKYGEYRNINISMDNIQISKSRTGATSLLDLKEAAQEYKNNGYPSKDLVEETDEGTITKPECKYVGFDCRACDCHFSNIIVIDYLVGMRVFGENNNVYGVHIWNTYCPEQYKYSVGFINGGTDNDRPNTYTACVVDKFHIGWLSSDTANFTLTNCHWLNKQIEIDMNKNGIIDSEVDGVKEIYGNKAYGFYIPTDVADSYAEGKAIGSNITANDCYMVGSDLDNDACFTNFCNRKEHSINYTGPTSNIFYAPIPEVEGSIQYGKIKTKSFVISNDENEKFNIYKLHPENFNFGESDELTFTTNTYMDNIANSSGGTGTIENRILTNTTIKKLNDDVEITVHNPNSQTYTGASQIMINLGNLGYQIGDVGCISFDYYTEAEDTSTGDVFQEKELSIRTYEKIADYFTGELIGSVPLEQSTLNDANNFKSMTCLFKITDFIGGSMGVCIGHGIRTMFDENGKLISGTYKKRNVNPIKIKNLRVIKIPSDSIFPKYYMETEDKYKERILNFLSGLDYDDKIEEPACIDENLAFVSLPFKYKIEDILVGNSAKRYLLTYSKLGRPCFSIADTDDINSFKNAFKMDYDVGSPNRLYGTKGYIYLNSDVEPLLFKYGINAHLTSAPWVNTMIDRDNSLFSYDFNENVSKYDTTFFLPDIGIDDIISVNIINNPYGYYFESPVDAKYDDSNNKPIEVDIPLYANGEIRLIMKNTAYNTELPTVFI